MLLRLTPGRWLAILCGLIAIATAAAVIEKVRGRDEAATNEWEVMTPPTRLHPDDDDGDALRRYGRQPSALAQQKRAAQRDAMDRRGTVLPDLFGDRPGAPGALFAGLDLRRGWSTDAALAARIATFEAATGGHVLVGMDELVVTVPPAPDQYSDDVRGAGHAAWPWSSDDRWLDPDDGVRAQITVDASGTRVRWQRALAAAALFPPDPSTPGALVPAIGGPADAPLPLDTYATTTATGFTYALPPIGWSPDPVRVTVDVAHGVVTAVHVETGALGDDEREDVKLALHARYGAQVNLDGPASWRAGGVAVRSTLLVDSRLTNAGPLLGYRLDLTRARR